MRHRSSGLWQARTYLNHPTVAATLLATGIPAGAQEPRFNMTRGATEISQQVFDLHMTIFYICVAIALVVFSLMFWSIIHHRKAKGVVPAQFHGSMKIEILWTAIPVLILIAMAVPATRTLIAMEDVSASELTVLVTGSQWKWHYKYLDYPIEFYSVLATPRAQIANEAEKSPDYLMAVDKPLVLPTGKKVRFLLTADDVIHSWWVPDFAIKKDAVPGFINETWTRVDKPGLYYGKCAELCGRDHGFMPVAVEVKTPEDFEAWAAQQVALAEQARAEAATAGPMSMDELMALGQEVYDRACVACHQPNGEGLAGVFPGLKGSAIAMGEPAAHIHIVLFGKEGTAMQAFGKQLSAKELAAVITYERNAWGNAKGDMVQPADVAAAIEKGE
ncbi:MAG: cytochrome c oxidase subunit II [Thauera sp.]|uniref:cytochrome c oxidase subunit II n=1 Tax=Thauera sp. JM12B12 TaxID=3142262 RepID=UPI0029C40418|nr:cytochrome c oxidase subunit II [Thauera sp.]